MEQSYERDLVARMSHHGEAAWAEFAKRYEGRIFGFARSRGLQVADAEDVTQNTLLGLCRSIGNFELDEERGTLWNWVATIVSREILRQQDRNRRALRSRNRDIVRAAITAQVSRLVLSMRILDGLYKQALERTRRMSRSTDWQVFRALWIELRDPQAVAREENRTVQSVYRTKFRVMEVLRRQVESLLDDSTLA